MTITHTAEQFHRILSDVTREVTDVHHLTNNTDRIVHKPLKQLQRQAANTCLPIAAFVLAYGRLLLYKYLCKVHKALL